MTPDQLNFLILTALLWLPGIALLCLDFSWMQPRVEAEPILTIERHLPNALEAE